MKLPIPFLKSKKTNNEYYLALLLDDEKACSVILEEEVGKVKIVGKHVENLPLPLETIPLDDLIKVVDKTISNAEEVLPPNIETHKTVFGVKESWVEEESKKIKKEYLSKLKKVCDALDLSPIGFMVISEAIANLLQSEESAPLSAVLADFGKNTVNLTLFRSGKIIESIISPMSESAPATVDAMLKGFNAPVLPTRIILFHGDDVDTLAQKFMRHEWSKSLPFLHVPQITVLPPDFDAKAVTFGAARQMGFDVLGITGKILPPPVEEIDHQESDKAEKELIEEKSAPAPELVPPPVPEKVDNFGFALDQDVADQPIKEHIIENPSENEIDENSIDEQTNTQNLKEDTSGIRSETDTHSQYENKTSKKSVLSGFLASIPAIKLPKMPKLPTALIKNKGVKLPLIIGGVILILAIGLYAFYIYNVSAQVVLSVKPKIVTEDASVTFSTSGASDFSKKVIAGHSVTVSIDGDLSTPATGKKDTGDKAKGTIIIYNSSDSSQSLSSGTAVKSSKGITFTLDKDVNISSSSGDIFTGTKPGTAQASVTAKEIGPESNLPSGSKFAIGGNTSLAAKNDSAFSGGSKKTITVVSREDIAKLKSELPKSLESKARDELAKKAQSGETILNGFVSETIDKPKFDKAVDDEAKQVKLTGSINFEGVSYKNEDIENFDKSILKDHYSSDISFAGNSLKNDVKDAKVKNDKEIQTSLKITAGLLPKIDKDEVMNKIKNKSPKQTKEIIGTLPQVVSSEIKYTPNIALLADIFQRLPKNLSVLVKSE